MSHSTSIDRFDEYFHKVSALAPHYAHLLRKSFDDALAEFVKSHAKLMRLYNARDYATVMHAHLRGKIKENFAGLPGVYFDERPGRSFKLLIDGRVHGIDVFLAIILKKLGKGYRTSNIRTRSVRRFNNQQQIPYVDFAPEIQETLFRMTDEHSGATVVNLPRFANLVAGYKIQPTWDAFVQLAMTMPFSLKHIRLINDFTGATAVTVAEVIDFRQSETEKPRRIRPRRVGAEPQRKKLRRIVSAETKNVESEHLPKKRKRDERNS